MKNKIESVVIVHGKKGSVATLHFTDTSKSCYISGDKEKIHAMVLKRLRKVVKNNDSN